MTCRLRGRLPSFICRRCSWHRPCCTNGPPRWKHTKTCRASGGPSRTSWGVWKGLSTFEMTSGRLAATTSQAPTRAHSTPLRRGTEPFLASVTSSQPHRRARSLRVSLRPNTLTIGAFRSCLRMARYPPAQAVPPTWDPHPIVMMNQQQSAADDERRKAQAGPAPSPPPPEPKARPTPTGGGASSSTGATGSSAKPPPKARPKPPDHPPDWVIPRAAYRIQVVLIIMPRPQRNHVFFIGMDEWQRCISAFDHPRTCSCWESYFWLGTIFA